MKDVLFVWAAWVDNLFPWYKNRRGYHGGCRADLEGFCDR